MYQNKEVIGTILPPFDAERRRQSKNGWFLDFIVESSDGKVVPCRVFQEVAEAAGEVLAAGKKVALFGYLNGEQLRVRVARDPEKPAIAKHVAFNGQTKEEVQKEFDERVRYMAKRGIVPVKEKSGIAWVHHSYTIRDGKERKLKLEFAMERLGAKYVFQRLRSKEFVVVGRAGVAMAAGLKARYMQVLEELVQEAQGIDEVGF